MFLMKFLLGFRWFDGWENEVLVHVKFACIEEKYMGLSHASLHGYIAEYVAETLAYCELFSSPLFPSLLVCEMT